jgi:hypothetical protein
MVERVGADRDAAGDFCFMNHVGQMELARMMNPGTATGTVRTLTLWSENKPQPAEFAAMAIMKLLQGQA